MDNKVKQLAYFSLEPVLCHVKIPFWYRIVGKFVNKVSEQVQYSDLRY